MTLAQADKILNRGGMIHPPQAVVDQKSLGQIVLKNYAVSWGLFSWDKHLKFERARRL